jgi:hypothetical protein
MAVRDSRTAAVLSTARKRLGRALATAETASRLGATADRLGELFADSRFADALRWGGRASRSSWLYRWLTSEPDPEVVVIDLRETAVVGPIIGVLDWLLGGLATGWTRARSGKLFEDLWATLLARPIQVASVLALAGLAANLLVLAALDSLSAGAVGVRLVAVSLALAGSQVTVSWDVLRESRVVELTIALLEPPEPPEQVEQERKRQKRSDDE